MSALLLAPKSMQEGWGSGGDDVGLGTSQWEDEDGGVWNNAASQESTSSCSSWGNAPKKGLQKVCVTLKKRYPKSHILFKGGLSSGWCHREVLCALRSLGPFQRDLLSTARLSGGCAASLSWQSTGRGWHETPHASVGPDSNRLALLIKKVLF